MNTKITHLEQHSTLEHLKDSFRHIYELGNIWLQRQKTRRQLAELPAYLLRDIGMSEAERYRESNKHFWQN